MSARILVIDQDRAAREMCLGALRSLGFSAQAADSRSSALAMLEGGEIDIVLAAVNQAEAGGLALLKAIRRNYPQVDMVMMTDRESAGERAARLGAHDFIAKPLRREQLKNLLERLAEKQALAAENRLLREQVSVQEGFGSLIGTSARMQKIYRLIVRVAPRRHPVLILGESGTGKELVARAIHTHGPWRHEPFVPVDCGALAPTLIESELFGHVRGAFTGASQNRSGLLAAAGAGTVFLDEIAELPLELQSKLLRALQEREFRPLGGNARIRLEARVLAATNQDAESAVRRGMLRKDLYFRLNVVTLKLPPLRERKSDIPLLAHRFIDQAGGEREKITGISYEAMTRLMNYDWPGNVRELENCIQRALALGSGPLIQVKDLPSNLLYPALGGAESPEITTLRELERRAILQALEAAAGDRLRAAKLLGIGKTTIYRKLKEYGLEDASAPPETP